MPWQRHIEARGPRHRPASGISDGGQDGSERRVPFQGGVRPGGLSESTVSSTKPHRSGHCITCMSVLWASFATLHLLFGAVQVRTPGPPSGEHRSRCHAGVQKGRGRRKGRLGWGGVGQAEAGSQPGAAPCWGESLSSDSGRAAPAPSTRAFPSISAPPLQVSQTSCAAR